LSLVGAADHLSGPPRRFPSSRIVSRGLVCLLFGVGSTLALLLPPVDAIADSDLTVHMFQHIGLFVGGAVLGYGLEIIIMSKLATLRRMTLTGWRLFTGVMKLNSSTGGIAFVVVIPALVFAYWHIPQNFDLAVQNESIHGLEHLTYITTGSLAGLSIQAVSRKWRIILLYLGFMQAGMMGSMWTVWRPGYFPIYSYAANLEMGTAMMVFGAVGILATSSWMLKVLDII
jgi:Protein of unknown function (DUF1404)/Cytochrome c oxidase caa3 assembly factor (Caa3_CtaG)